MASHLNQSRPDPHSTSRRPTSPPQLTVDERRFELESNIISKADMATVVEPFPSYANIDLSDLPARDFSETADTPSPNRRLARQSSGAAHTRNYKACEGCRSRKVKCDLGPVDNPHEPPCERCKRERKECVMADTRRKKRSPDADTAEEHAQRHVRARTDLTSSEPGNAFINAAHRHRNSDAAASSLSMHASTSHLPRSQMSRPPPRCNPSLPTNSSQDLRGMTQPSPVRSDSREQLRSHVAAATLSTAVATTQDSLSLLSHAASLSENNRTALPGQTRSPSAAFNSPQSAHSAHPRSLSNNMNPGHPGLLAPQPEDTDKNAALRVWSHMRFVTSGWFTAKEAMEYVEYFYEQMAPMTPIVTPDFRSPSRHQALLTEEPILAVAILTMASRHKELAGPGALSRGYQIHDNLWKELQGMVQRLLWGQEQFGGGFTGAGSVNIRESTGGQITWKGSLRTMGTVEALLLLTDWQPRALHFPPSAEDNRLVSGDLLLPSEMGVKKEEHDTVPSSINDTLPFASFMEPTWRSDRMSWMLLGLAQALSFELGVFDKKHYECRDNHDHASDCARKRRIRRLVLVYASQTSGRLGIQCMLSVPKWEDDPIFEQTNQAQRNGRPEDPIDMMQSCWLHIASIMYKANQKIFPTRQFTRALTASDEFRGKIAEFKPLLQSWKVRFEQLESQMQPLMRHILIMEYEYARCYINSLGLQKVVESWVELSREAAIDVDDLPHTNGNSIHNSGVDQMRLNDIAKPNLEYVEEVADSARNILRTVVEGIGPGNLRNAPVRTYLRAMSGMMFTLKRFALGAYENDVRVALDLLDRATAIMSKDVVDDVHLSSQNADLVKLIVGNIRKTFIRIQPPTTGSEIPSQTHSRHQTPQHGPVTQDHDNRMHLNNTRPRTNTNANYHTTIPYYHDPLDGIQSARPEEAFSEHTFMPPPPMFYPTNNTTPSNGNGNGNGTGMDANMNNFEFDNPWMALPLDQLLNNPTGGIVDQGFGGIGPTIGDRDMLELITDQQYEMGEMGGYGFQ